VSFRLPDSGEIIVLKQNGLHGWSFDDLEEIASLSRGLSNSALAERAMSLWPNKGEADKRPPLGSGYERVDQVMPHRPLVPTGALGERRLDAKKSGVIPEYPY
jgi:cholesterol oxidase